MPTPIWITIDGKSLKVPADITILEAAALAGVDISTICYHDRLSANGVCRICVVEKRGSGRLAPACTTQVTPDAVILTDSARVRTARRTILEMLNSATDLSEAPALQDMMDEYGADRNRFGEDAKRRLFDGVKDDNPFYIRDYDKCILCWRCVQVCAEDVQYTFALGFNNRGFDTEITTFFDHGMQETTCVFCGNCVGVCPTGALKGKRELDLEPE